MVCSCLQRPDAGLAGGIVGEHPQGRQEKKRPPQGKKIPHLPGYIVEEQVQLLLAVTHGEVVPRPAVPEMQVADDEDDSSVERGHPSTSKPDVTSKAHGRPQSKSGFGGDWKVIGVYSRRASRHP
jgi:hypothetical protein